MLPCVYLLLYSRNVFTALLNIEQINGEEFRFYFLGRQRPLHFQKKIAIQATKEVHYKLDYYIFLFNNAKNNIPED